MPPVGFEPMIPEKHSAADIRLRPRGHWDRLSVICSLDILRSFVVPMHFLDQNIQIPRGISCVQQIFGIRLLTRVY
jgi:hypothetical protein